MENCGLGISCDCDAVRSHVDTQGLGGFGLNFIHVSLVIQISALVLGILFLLIAKSSNCELIPTRYHQHSPL